MARYRLGNTIIVIASIILVTASTSSFDGYVLMAVTPRTVEHQAFLMNLESQYTEPMVNVTSRIVVPPSLLSTFKDKMQKQNLVFRVASSDITSLVEASYAKVDPKVSPFLQSLVSSDDFHEEYHDYDEIEKFLTNLQTQYPDNIALSYLNYQTHENREVILAKVSGSSGTFKPVIIIEAGIHAREWISPAANLYAIDKLLQGYQLGSEPAKLMLDTYDWHFVPVANPDGYVYSHSHSSFLLVPWGYTEYIHRPDNGEELDRVATLMSRAIESTSGKSYLVGTAYELLQYAASGSSGDWALMAKPDIYAICYELRPDFQSDVGFLLPPEEIVATGEEYLASLEVLAREMRL